MIDPTRQCGYVKNYDQEKGFGFIVPDAGGGDAFVHYKSIKAESRAYKCLNVGEYVEYRPEWDYEKNRNVAEDVTGAYGAPLQCAFGPPKGADAGKGKGFDKGGKGFDKGGFDMKGKGKGKGMDKGKGGDKGKGKGKGKGGDKGKGKGGDKGKGKGKDKGKGGKGGKGGIIKGKAPYSGGWDEWGGEWGGDWAADTALPSIYDPEAQAAWQAVMFDPYAEFWKAVGGDTEAMNTWKACQLDATHIFWRTVACDPTTAAVCVDFPAKAAAAAAEAKAHAEATVAAMNAALPTDAPPPAPFDPSLPLPDFSQFNPALLHPPTLDGTFPPLLDAAFPPLNGSGAFDGMDFPEFPAPGPDGAPPLLADNKDANVNTPLRTGMRSLDPSLPVEATA